MTNKNNFVKYKTKNPKDVLNYHNELTQNNNKVFIFSERFREV